MGSPGRPPRLSHSSRAFRYMLDKTESIQRRTAPLNSAGALCMWAGDKCPCLPRVTVMCQPSVPCCSWFSSGITASAVAARPTGPMAAPGSGPVSDILRRSWLNYDDGSQSFFDSVQIRGNGGRVYDQESQGLGDAEIGLGESKETGLSESRCGWCGDRIRRVMVWMIRR